MSLALQLLGLVQVTWDSTPLKFATEHTRALLVYLAVEADVTHRRTTLATLLWPEEDEVTARRNLRQALFFLKQSLAPVPHRAQILQVTPTTIQWHSQAVEVDLRVFQTHWRLSQQHHHARGEFCTTCIEHVTQAVALYQGEFLPGLLLKANPLFEEWLLLLREQSHRQAAVMLRALTTYYEQRGDYDQMHHYAARQVALEPWDETGQRQLMQALVAQRQPSTALRHYESYRRSLEQDLGAAPAEETTRLYEQIRAGMVDKRQGWSGDTGIKQASPLLLDQSRQHNLPINLVPLVGRREQLTQLQMLMGQVRLLTLVGLGGMGKSRLALALAEALVAETPTRFADGIWFVPLIGVAATVPHLPDALAGAVLSALGITTAQQAALQQVLWHYLATRQALLLLDNFEHFLLAEDTATAGINFIQGLLHAAPGVTLVVTSRLPLHLLTERVIRLEGLPVPDRVTTTAARRDSIGNESVRLFAYHAQRTLPGFTLQDDNLAAIMELCRALSGMPLAIELAAALTPHFTPDELLAAIRQNLALLASTRRDLDVRHRQFSAVLHSSWLLLTPREQQVLAQCAIFAGHFSRAAAQAVTDATISELASLVDKALIQQPGVGVYQLHDLLRQFATDQLQGTPQAAQAVADRHSAYYLNFVAQRERMLARDAPRQAIEEIQGEVDNVRQAWAWAAGHTTLAATTSGARLAASAYSLCHFYLATGRYSEGVDAFHGAATGVQAICATLTQPDGPGYPAASGAEATMDGAALPHWQSLLSTLLGYESYLLSRQGSYGPAQRSAEQAVTLGAVAGNQAGTLMGLATLVQVHYYQGQWDAAKQCAEQLLAQVQQRPGATAPNEYVYDAQMLAYLHLGTIARNVDAYEQAHRYITQALQLCQSLGKLSGVMHARLNLANLARYKQDYGVARQEYEQVLQLAATLGYRRSEAMARYELADIKRGQGEYMAALAELTCALTILREIGAPFYESYALTDSGRIYAYLGDYAQAQALVQQGLACSENFTIPDAKIEGWLATALLHQLTGAAAVALDYATRSREAASAQGSRRYEGCALLYMGDALAALERWSAAQDAYTQALQLYQQLDIPPVIAEVQAGLARLMLAQGDPVAALTWVQKLLPSLTTGAGSGSTQPTRGLDEPFQIYLTCYQVLTANGDPRAACILQQGHCTLRRYAEQITDDKLRRSFLTDVPAHHMLYQIQQALV